MATTVDIERIDIIEGPSRNDLLIAERRTKQFRDQMPAEAGAYQTRFDEARYYDARDNDMRRALEGAISLRGELAEVAYLGDDPYQQRVFLIKVNCAFGTFEGHYDSYRRKGTLMRSR